MQKRCYYCGEPKWFDDPKELMCDECRIAGYKLTFPGTTGLSDGPTSGMNQVHFNKPDPYKETLRALKIAEEAGRLRNPVDMNVAKEKIKRLKAQQHLQPKIDYNKRGGEAHPLSGVSK